VEFKKANFAGEISTSSPFKQTLRFFCEPGCLVMRGLETRALYAQDRPSVKSERASQSHLGLPKKLN